MKQSFLKQDLGFWLYSDQGEICTQEALPYIWGTDHDTYREHWEMHRGSREELWKWISSKTDTVRTCFLYGGDEMFEENLPVFPNVEIGDIVGFSWHHLANLESFESLVELKLTGNLDSLKGIEALKHLRYVNFRDMKPPKDIDRFASLPHLRAIRFDQYPCEDLTPLSGCENLNYIELFRSRKLKSLKGLPKSVEYIFLQRGTGLTNFESLPEDNTLKGIQLDSCTTINEIVGLPKARNLKYFGIYDDRHKIRDFSCLEKIQGIEKLHLVGYRSDNLDLIFKFPSLRSLFLWTTGVSRLKESDLDDLCRRIPELYVVVRGREVLIQNELPERFSKALKFPRVRDLIIEKEPSIDLNKYLPTRRK